MLFSVDGYYKDWSSWGQCSVSCGGGEQHRQRECVEPLHGGQECQGPADETQACNEHHCPGMLRFLRLDLMTKIKCD